MAGQKFGRIILRLHGLTGHKTQCSTSRLTTVRASSPPPPRIDCRRTSDGSNECYHARTDPIGRAKIRSASRLPHVGCQTGQALGKSDQQQPGSNRENRYFEIHEGPVLNAIGSQRSG